MVFLLPHLHLLLAMIGFLFVPSESAVTLTKDNHSLVFPSTDASFAPKVPSTGVCGIIFLSNPFNACTPLDSDYVTSLASTKECVKSLRFVLVSRGLCSFEVKVRHAQDAGYDAIIVADNIGRHQLLTMAGSKNGIMIPAVFVSKIAGEILAQHTNGSHPDCWILPSSFESISWLVMITAFMFLLSVIAAFAIYFLVQSGRQTRSRGSKECRGISRQTVKALPTDIYKCEDGIQTIDTCAICLEDYIDGSSLRILPCHHRFHCSCIDAWLVNWRGFCPICKKNVTTDNSTSSECTPLLNNEEPVGQQLASQQVSLISGEASINGVNATANSRQYNENEVFDNHYARCNNVAPTPIRIMGASRHMSLQSLFGRHSRRQDVRDPMDAFRASPYFTPPSFFHNSAPNVLLPIETSSSGSPGDSRHGDNDVRAFMCLPGEQFIQNLV